MLKLALDSGAHSIYNIEFAGISGVKGATSRKHSKYDFYKSQKFKNYLEAYIEFVHANSADYEFYVNLDIIFNGELTWEMQKYMEDNGLNPIPVYHFAEDIKFLKRYVDNYDYVGIGGLGQDITKKKFIKFGDKAFDVVKKEDGTPRVKTHGFAVASLDILKRYPWYSADAATWGVHSRNGAVCLPRPIWKGKEAIGYDYSQAPLVVSMTEGAKKRKNHYDRLPELHRQVFSDYFNTIGVEVDSLKEYGPRDYCNVKFFQGVERWMKGYYKEQFNFESGGNLYIAGQASASHTIAGVHRIVESLKDTTVRWLGSFYYRKHAELLLKASRELAIEFQ